MTCPQQEPNALAVDLYDFVRAIDEPRAVETVAPAPMPGAGKRVLAYRNPRHQTSAVDQYFPDKIKDLYAPLWLIGGSTVVQIIGTYLATRGAPGSFSWGLAQLTAQMIIGTILMLVGILVAARIREISFGPFWTALLKLAAISVAPDAIRWAGGLFFYLIPVIGPIVNWLIGFCIYFALIGVLFDLDENDTWYCVCVIFVVKLAVFLAILAGLFGTFFST
jgi:hypothetical protein